MLQAEKTEIIKEALPETLKQTDSIKEAVRDSLQNIQNLSDIKEVITGENPILKNAINSLVELTAGFIPRILIAILFLWLGFKLVKLLKKAITKIMDKNEMDTSLRGFLTSFIDVLLKALIIITVMDIIGIKATSFIAIIGAAGLAVGMALQGTLQNFAGGVIILIMKPFKVGDYINGGGHEGFVKEIRIFNTYMLTFDKKVIIIPNTELATSTLINYSKEEIRRVDVKIGIAYGESTDKAREVLLRLSRENPYVYQEREAVVVVTKLNDSSVDLVLRTWATVENYWLVYEGMNEIVYKAFNENGISIPFPQVQVHMDK
ncbi:MAG: mechanosensitive ion channel [Bacteroidales bacterium]|nr:mechanosensitive ion channel [Bacteroidales bacterium]